MSGERCLLDTNAIVALLQGDVRLIQLLRQAEWIGISVISRIEFLAFSGLTEADRQLFQYFLQRVEVLGLAADDSALIEKIIAVRQQHLLKLPDAVIAAMAMQKNAALVTADREFAKATDLLTVINWNDGQGGK
jgi:predicted nucleic acid-binding protein